ncbi:MAG: hypothetical protein HFH48_02290 [Lachnospiraceae bacterium]|nr:hypothetical protein [Lachnospiraceae bacterium]
MRKSLSIVTGLLCCFLLGQNLLPAEAAQKIEETQEAGTAQEGKDYVETTLEAEDADVTLTVRIRKESQITSGRIAVYCDSDLLELSEAKTGNLWETEDVNDKMTEDGKKGLSYAWADTGRQTEEGTLITVSFRASERADGQEVSVETRILELYSEQTVLSPAWKKKTDKVKIHLEDGRDKPDNEESNQEEASEEEDGESGEQKSGSGVQTGDDTNLAGWILTAFGAVLVILDAGRKVKNIN